jgi:hypothetical protein
MHEILNDKLKIKIMTSSVPTPHLQLEGVAYITCSHLWLERRVWAEPGIPSTSCVPIGKEIKALHPQHVT